MAVIRKSLKQITASKARVDHAKVAATSEAAIRRQMIADGESAGARRAADSFSPVIVRKRLGMTQSEFASALGIPVATLRNWEQGRNAIDPAARALLILVAKTRSARSRRWRVNGRRKLIPLEYRHSLLGDL